MHIFNTTLQQLVHSGVAIQGGPKVHIFNTTLQQLVHSGVAIQGGPKVHIFNTTLQQLVHSGVAIIVVKFEDVKLKFEKVRKSSRCTFNHNYYQKTLSYMGLGLCNLNKKLSYRRGTARCVVSIEILPIATRQYRNYLYDKS